MGPSPSLPRVQCPGNRMRLAVFPAQLSSQLVRKVFEAHGPITVSRLCRAMHLPDPQLLHRGGGERSTLFVGLTRNTNTPCHAHPPPRRRRLVSERPAQDFFCPCFSGADAFDRSCKWTRLQPSNPERVSLAESGGRDTRLSPSSLFIQCSHTPPPAARVSPACSFADPLACDPLSTPFHPASVPCPSRRWSRSRSNPDPARDRLEQHSFDKPLLARNTPDTLRACTSSSHAATTSGFSPFDLLDGVAVVSSGLAWWPGVPDR